MDANNFSLIRWTYRDGEWRKVETKNFSTRSRTLKGISLAMRTCIGHQISHSDLFLAGGRTFYGKEPVLAIYCPCNRFEGAYMANVQEEATAYLENKEWCRKEVEKRAGGDDSDR